MKIEDLWAVLWSQCDGYLHAEKLMTTTQDGMKVLIGEAGLNYEILLWVGPESEMEGVCAFLQRIVDARRESDRALGL